MADSNGSSKPPTGNGRVTPDDFVKLATENADLRESMRAVWNSTWSDLMLNRGMFMQSLLDPRRDIDRECGYPESGGIVDIQVYRMLYDREAIANRVVHMYPKECWQNNPEVFEDETGETPTDFEQAWDAIEVWPGSNGGLSWHQDDKGSTIWEHLFRADVLSGIGSFGVILLGIDDGRDLQEPIEGAVSVPEGYNPQGSISQTGSITSGIVFDPESGQWVPKGQAAAGGYAPTPGAFIQGTDEQYSTGNPSTSPAQLYQSANPTKPDIMAGKKRGKTKVGNANPEGINQYTRRTSSALHEPSEEGPRLHPIGTKFEWPGLGGQYTLHDFGDFKDIKEKYPEEAAQAISNLPPEVPESRLGRTWVMEHSSGQKVLLGKGGLQFMRRLVQNAGADVWKAVGDFLKQHTDPAPMPGYGQIFLQPNEGNVWYVGGDGDEDGFADLVREQLGQVGGVNDVTVEAEGFPPRDEGWVQVYPKKATWNSNPEGHNQYMKGSLGRKIDPDSPQGMSIRAEAASEKANKTNTLEDHLAADRAHQDAADANAAYPEVAEHHEGQAANHQEKYLKLGGTFNSQWSDYSILGSALTRAYHQRTSNRRFLFNRDSPIREDEARALLDLGSKEVTYTGLDGKSHTRTLPTINAEEKKAVEKWLAEKPYYTQSQQDGMWVNNSEWRCNQCKATGSLSAAPSGMVVNTKAGPRPAHGARCPVCNADPTPNPSIESSRLVGYRNLFQGHPMFNKVTEAIDARGRTIYAQPPGKIDVDPSASTMSPPPNRQYRQPGYDGSEYPYHDNEAGLPNSTYGGPSGGATSAEGYDDPYKSASGVNYSSAAGYGLPSGVAMPAGALSGTDQQYFGVQFGPSEVASDVPAKQKRRLLFLRCFDESLVQVVRYEWNVRNPRFGLPVMYRITLNDPREQHSGVGLPLATVFVHWSRVIHIIDNYQSSGTSEVFGVPRMRPVLNRLLDLRKIYSGAGEGYWKSVIANLYFTTHPQLGGDVNVDAAGISDAMQKMENGLQRWMILMGMNPQTTPIELKDPTPHIAAHLEAIAIQIGCPIRVLKGSERGELASSQDDSKWNDRIKHRQHFHITPQIIVQFIDRLIAIGVLPEPKGYTVRWPDLDANTDAQKATIASTVTTALGAYVSQNVESMIPPAQYLMHVLNWDEELVKAILDEAKKAHAAMDTMTQPPQIAGQPAEAAEGTQAAADKDDAKEAAKQKADALAQVAKAKAGGNNGNGGGEGEGQGDGVGDEGDDDSSGGDEAGE